jgi:peptidoglycan glycosyltransferase
VWSGNNNNETTAKVESLTGGGVIWHNIMEELFKDPRFEQVLAEPYGGELPLEFTLPPEIVRKPICPLPGPFGNYSQELFAPDMLKRDDATPTAGGDAQSTKLDSSCDVYKQITVAQLGEVPVGAENGEVPDVTGKYCKPVEGMVIPPGMLTTISVWNVPPPDPDEKVDYHWRGGGAISAAQIPDCSDEIIASVAPPGSVRMPDLRKLGENQAKELLASLGVTNIYVDYQTRERIPQIYDSVGPYVVLSTLPAPGDWIRPDTTVVLGIRAPDPQSPPPDAQPPAPTPWP